MGLVSLFACFSRSRVFRHPCSYSSLNAIADPARLGDVATAQARRTESFTAAAGRWGQAQDLYEKSLATWRKIPRPSPLSPNGLRVGDPQVIARRDKVALQHTQQ
jgi:hypothetical protein